MANAKGTAAVVIAAAAAVLAAAALIVALTHAGPRGFTGPAGPAGAPGAAGQDGQDAPALSYQCQMLMPKNGSTDTTFYWPCTDSPAN